MSKEFEAIAKILKIVVKEAVKEEFSKFKKEMLVESTPKRKTKSNGKVIPRQNPSLIDKLQSMEDGFTNSKKINRIKNSNNVQDILSEVKRDMQSGNTNGLQPDASNPYETIGNFTTSDVSPGIKSMRDMYMSEMSSEFGGRTSTSVIDSEKVSTIQAVKNSGNESKAVQMSAVEKALTRDYSGLVKKIEEKKGKR